MEFTETPKYTFFEDISDQLNSYNYNAFQVNEISNNHPLVKIGLDIFERQNFYSTLKCNREDVLNIFTEIENNYLPNPYHNAMHASDVTQALFSIIVNSPIIDVIEKTEFIAIILAAAIHDIKHPGVTNSHLKDINHQLYREFGNESTLEKYHAQFGTSLLQQSGILSRLTNEQQERIMHIINQLIVIGTDMTKHPGTRNEIQTMLNSEYDLTDFKTRLSFFKLAIACADLSAQTRDLTIALQWTEVVYEEFFQQGDIEKMEGLKIGNLNNRETVNSYKSQIGFIKFCVKPLFTVWTSAFKNGFSTQILENMENNLTYFENNS